MKVKACDDNCSILYEYMKKLLCGMPMRESDLERMEEPIRKLAAELRELHQMSREREEQLRAQAHFDAGTGIHNRHFFEAHMDRMLAEGISAALCYMDLDGLKFVNDNFGHKAGDIYISSFVAEIQNGFRSSDVFARVGGDEFCLIQPMATKEVASRKMRDLRHRFVMETERDYPAGFSYGVVEINGKSNTLTLEEILEMADAEMYRDKKRKRVQRESA